MRIDLAFTPREVRQQGIGKRDAVVIDVIRAATTMVTGLHNGALAFIPVATPEEAVARADKLSRSEVLLAGERRGERLEGFALGNSPREYTREAVSGKRVLFTTSNGTIALLSIEGAEGVAVCAFVNVSAVARWVIARGHDLLIICSGASEGFSLEDTVCGGMLISRLQRGTTPELTNSALAARLLYEHYRGREGQVLEDSEWGQHLQRIGFGGDLPLCVRIDAFDTIPLFRDGAVALS